MGNRVELDEMGKRILDASRTELYLSMRFLGPALHSLGFIMDLSTTTVGTDAVYIRFNPNWIFRLYVDRPRLLNRTYLHMLLHCVFRHMYTARRKEDRELWDLASDIAVGSIIDSMEYRAVYELTPEYRRRVYEKLQAEIHVLTAERIYQYFIERKRNYLEELQMRAAFALCDHSFWERMEDEPEDQQDSRDGAEEDRNEAGDPGGGDEDSGQEDSRDEDHDRDFADREREDSERKDSGQEDSRGEDPGNRRKKGPETGGEKPSKDARGNHPDRPGDTADPTRRDRRGQDPRARKSLRQARRLRSVQDRERQWQETSRRMEAEILASGKEASNERGSLERILSISNRRRTDYREFLRRFAVLRELTTIDPDSFDYGFYNYGLQVYGNMPLIEENEYREANRIRTLVIAIDTSASCQDVLVQRFLNETGAVLRNIAGFFHTFEVHILECDEHVQGERVIHTLEELEQYADHFRVRGGFGTDFRPVFARVEEKRKKREIRDLAGLMYFTDGMGIYPEKATDYDTAFVFFNDEELDDSRVPDWAIRLYMGEKEAPVIETAADRKA